MKRLHLCNFWQCGPRVGAFLAALFIICFAWFWLRGGDAALQALHFDLLRLSFFSFTDMNAASFILGLIQAYIWGYIAVFLWILAGCCGKGQSCQMCQTK